MRAFNPFASGDAQIVKDRRWMMLQQDMQNPLSILRGGRNVGGPLPSRGWDSFFGSLLRKQADAERAGMDFDVDLVGRKGTSGIGRLKGQELTEQGSGTGLPFSIQGLQRAARRR